MVWSGFSARFMMRIVRYRQVVGVRAERAGGFTCVILSGCYSLSRLGLVVIVVVVVFRRRLLSDLVNIF